MRQRRMIAALVAALVAAIVLAGCSSSPGPSKSTARHDGSSTSTTPSENAAAEIIPSTPTGTVTVQEMPQTAKNPTTIDGVLAWDTQVGSDGSTPAGAISHEHVTGPVSYAIVPPVGGPHNAIWMNAGVYTKPIPSERAVHNLEHGGIWITYNPSLPAVDVAQLVSFVGRQSLIDESNATGIAGQKSRFMDLSPWATDTLPAPIVISAWGYQLRVTSPSDPRLQEFVDAFRHNPDYTTEYGAPVDGIPVQTGGVPAALGATQPNPPGTAGQ